MYLAFYDDSKRPLEQKIRDAAAVYQAKFGIAAHVAYVSPAEACQVEGIAVLERTSIRRNNFWIGRLS